MTAIPSDNENTTKLNYWQAAALLVADCMGVGILALPQDVHVLGWTVGLGFLLLNIPINYYAGTKLADAALQVEEQHAVGDDNDDDEKNEMELTPVVVKNESGSEHVEEDSHSKSSPLRRKSRDGLFREKRTKYASVPAINGDIDDPTTPPPKEETIDEDDDDESHTHHQQQLDDTTTSTSDLIGITAALFRDARWTLLVRVIYYLNLLLVLGDYLLVMSHAVTAMVGENEICLPTAGILASLLMFALSQLNTMSLLGREVSIISVVAAIAILVQCLVATQQQHQQTNNDDDAPPRSDEEGGTFRKLSALASIGFAIGSQKLFLNIRHEMDHREHASRTLFISLATYGTTCILVTLAAGPDPPSFLFDAIPSGWGRRIAGFLLWGHVAVSYAINSQALCSSMDRLAMTQIPGFSQLPDRRRWVLLTFSLVIFSYMVANAIPFFKDLVALIGALTSVPLCLTLPLLLHRKAKQLALWWPYEGGVWPSYTALMYSLAFLVMGLVGSLSSIERDWRLHGRPFSCH